MNRTAICPKNFTRLLFKFCNFFIPTSTFFFMLSFRTESSNRGGGRGSCKILGSTLEDHPYLKRKMVGVPMAACTSPVVMPVSSEVHLLYRARLPSSILYGKSITSPALYIVPHLLFKCLTTDEIFFCLLRVSSRCGLYPPFSSAL